MNKIFFTFCLIILCFGCLTRVDEDSCDEALVEFDADAMINDTIYAPYKASRTVNRYTSKKDSLSRFAYHRFGSSFTHLTDTVYVSVALSFAMPIDSITWSNAYNSTFWFIRQKTDGKPLYADGIHSATVRYSYRKNKRRYEYEGKIEDQKLLQDNFRIRDANCDKTAYTLEMLLPEVTAYRTYTKDSVRIQNIKFKGVVQ